jgi:hypothetical protein
MNSAGTSIHARTRHLSKARSSGGVNALLDDGLSRDEPLIHQRAWTVRQERSDKTATQHPHVVGRPWLHIGDIERASDPSADSLAVFSGSSRNSPELASMDNKCAQGVPSPQATLINDIGCKSTTLARYNERIE